MVRVTGDGISGMAALQCPQCGASIPPSAGGQIICEYCGTTLVLAQTARDGPPVQTVIQGVKLKAHTLIDSQGTGLELLRMLIPVGWQFQGGCQWNYQNPGAPATVAFRVLNPAGVEGFEFFPPISCIWMPGGMGLMGQMMGGQYYGAEVIAPMGVHQALEELVVPRYRGGVANMQVLATEQLPGVAEELAALNPGTLGPGEAEAGKLRVCYDWQGQAMEEEIIGVVQTHQPQAMGMGGLFGMGGGPVSWFIDYLFAMRARRGQLDTLSELFDVMIRSVKLNPAWFAAYQQVQQQLVAGVIRSHQQVAQISRQISANADQITDGMLDSWRERQAAFDRISEGWSEATRGVDSYVDPHQDYPVELPGGYEHAWSNALGEYVVSNDHNFDPNIGATTEWTAMQRR